MELLLPDKKEIGKRLRKLRAEKTLDEVGSVLNVSSMAVSLWERGERTPNDEMKVRISKYYGVPVDVLFFT